MSVSNNLELVQPTDTQTNKMAVVSTALSQLERAVSDVLELDVTAGGNFELPYDDTDDLSDRTALRMVYLHIVGTPSSAVTVYHPDKRHLFYVQNSTDMAVTVRTVTHNGFVIGAGNGNVLLATETEMLRLLGSQSSIHKDFVVNYWGRPGPAERLATLLVNRPCRIPTSWNGSVGRCGVNPTVEQTIVVSSNGTPIINITVSTAGVFSFARASGSGPILLNVGDVLTFDAPATMDATFSEVQLALGSTSSILSGD